MTNPACKNCDRKDHCKMYADARAFYADVAEFGCKHFKPKQTKTNGDSIRSMMDEELAKFITSGYYQPHCPVGSCPVVEDCEDCWLRWLKKEVEK